MKVIVMLLLVCGFVAGCDGNDADTEAGSDSASRFERGMSRVGEKIESAAEGVQTEVNEARIQAVIDNIKGFDDVQAEIADEGVVTLIGSVDSEATRAEAEHIVGMIEGVTIVKNAISVGAVATGDTAATRDTVVIDTTKAP